MSAHQPFAQRSSLTAFSAVVDRSTQGEYPRKRHAFSPRGMTSVPSRVFLMPSHAFIVDTPIRIHHAIERSAIVISFACADGLSAIIVQPTRGALSAFEILAAAYERGHTPERARFVDPHQSQERQAPAFRFAVDSTSGVQPETQNAEKLQVPPERRPSVGMELER